MNIVQAQPQPATPGGYLCVIVAAIVVFASFLLWRGAKTRWKKDGHWGRKGLGADLRAIGMVALVGIILGLIFLRAEILPVRPEGYSCLIAAIIAVVASLILWRGAKARWKKDGHWGKGLHHDMIAMAMIAAIIGFFLLLVNGRVEGIRAGGIPPAPPQEIAPASIHQ